MYTRAAASDYDEWEAYGNPGWGSKDLIPLLQKAETYQSDVRLGKSTHGDSGPIKVSYGEEDVNVGTEFLHVAGAYDPERGLTDDVNDFYSCNKYGRWPKYIDAVSGRRSDTPHHYIYNQDHANSNLKVLDRCCVTRVVFEGNRAVGVEYVDDKADLSQGTQDAHRVYASRLVVVSGGAFGSPAILERSGIGATRVLKNLGIPQIVDLPGVGEHYMDHDGISVSYIASEDADTIDVIHRGDESEVKPYIDQWLQTGKGLISHNGTDAGIKMRPNATDLEELGPSFEKRWQSFFVDAPDKPVVWLGSVAAYVGFNPAVPRRKHYGVAYYSSYPESLGSVHITSASDPYAPLDFEGGSLKNTSDARVLRWVYKKGRELARRMKYYRGELDVTHPRFPVGSTAAATAADGPVDILAPDIAYSAEDDEVIDNFHRENIGTSWHSNGTCAMKPRDQGGVVDSMLNVYGVQNLKVSDLSIMPANVGSNTYDTAIAIGEKAAVIIAKELGIKGV